ncbi:MAG: hypothetical protein H0T50_02125 [Gemmatimonadales bacterium]|nr:hypothetical protein [Gemmatimonadales bacterium]
MTPALRKSNLTAHVTASVGGLGAVAGFLVLGIAGLTSQDAEIVGGAYLAMNLLGQFMIVPHRHGKLPGAHGWQYINPF